MSIDERKEDETDGLLKVRSKLLILATQLARSTGFLSFYLHDHHLSRISRDGYKFLADQFEVEGNRAHNLAAEFRKITSDAPRDS